MSPEKKQIIVNNTRRTKRVERLIKAGNYEAGYTAVRDMLADLRHYCDANDINFADEDRAAYQHYLHELQFTD